MRKRDFYVVFFLWLGANNIAAQSSATKVFKAEQTGFLRQVNVASIDSAIVQTSFKFYTAKIR
jgi:hypothetical protein